MNRKNVLKIDKNGRITIKPQLLRSMSAKSGWRERSLIAKEELKEDVVWPLKWVEWVEPGRHHVDRSMNLYRKIIRYKTRTISEPIDEDKLFPCRSCFRGFWRDQVVGSLILTHVTAIKGSLSQSMRIN